VVGETPPEKPGRSSVEIYRAVTGKYSWRVIAVAEDGTADALRAAKAVAFELEAEIYAEMAERHKQRRPAACTAAGIEQAV
jgi:hypothetical protein